jgi:hypothetical protein
MKFSSNDVLHALFFGSCVTANDSGYRRLVSQGQTAVAQFRSVFHEFVGVRSTRKERKVAFAMQFDVLHEPTSRAEETKKV